MIEGFLCPTGEALGQWWGWLVSKIVCVTCIGVGNDSHLVPDFEGRQMYCARTIFHSPQYINSSASLTIHRLLLSFILTFLGSLKIKIFWLSCWMACIAHCGVVLAPLSFGAMDGGIFDFHFEHCFEQCLEEDTLKYLLFRYFWRVVRR